jgi:hypothetical protein
MLKEITKLNILRYKFEKSMAGPQRRRVPLKIQIKNGPMLAKKVIHIFIRYKMRRTGKYIFKTKYSPSRYK